MSHSLKLEFSYTELLLHQFILSVFPPRVNILNKKDKNYYSDLKQQ